MESFRGLFAASVTPRRPDSAQIDLASYWDLIDFLGEFPFQGIVLMGSTGEFPHFDLEQRIKFLGLTVKRSRLPVIVNVTHSTLEGSLELADAASRANALGVLIMPPIFFRYGEADVRSWFEQFASEKPRTPALLYNIPAFTSPLSLDLAAELLRTGCFAGIKDSSGDWTYFERFQSSDFGSKYAFLVGNDELFLRARTAGAVGAVSGVSCAVPELMLALERAIASNNAQRATALNQRLDEFLTAISPFPVPVGIREALRARGLKIGPGAIPYTGQRAADIDGFRDWFAGWLKIVQSEVKSA
ncbi:MAG TPA: dihydrodipicolinate synthase family protein [Bryobacteraceae bacterium]|nr:dihydrodipicolinate synthase family protein [Bryobacteraceae bacterium]